jgi:hypothetical protein
MRVSFFFLVFIAMLSSGVFSCSDNDKILVRFNDGEEQNDGDPVPFMLQQNFPNPFNPSTNVSVLLKEPLHIKVAVYSIDWIEMEILVDNELPIGRSFFVVRATNYGSGEYFLLAEGGGYQQVRKIMLIK